MSDTQTTAVQLDRDDEIRRVVESVLLRRSLGEEVADESLIQQHPHLLPELTAELRKLAVIARARAQLNQRSLEIRCPLCHEQLAIVADQPLEDLVCTACRGRFNLAGDDPELKDRPPVTRIAHFELLERLGMGSFGTVWKARDIQLDRTVALKIPRRGQLDPGQVEEFLHEARVAAKLRHPHIVSVHEISRDGDDLFIVSDLVDGVSLETFKNTRPLTQRDAAQLLATVCDALHFAHQAGIVHRDLKPGNILIDALGQPHIADFGLAKPGQEELEITLGGEILGTPAYMSPEQARGDSNLADCRTDVYAIGVILFELLTDFLPFRGNVLALTQHAIHTEPPSPRRLNATISRDLETICLKCLEKDPQRRYASAADLAAELRRFLAGDEIFARPISRVERLARWCRKNPRIPTLSAALLLVTLIAYGVAWAWFESQVHQTDQVLTERALSSVRFAAESVAAQAGNDFEKYFELVERTARDPVLIERLQAMLADDELSDIRRQLARQHSESLRTRLVSHPLRQATQQWNEQFRGDLPIFASFVLLPDGLQISRHPLEKGETIGRNYAWRAYFNGLTEDKPKSWRPSAADQLRRTSLSPPFVSEFTDEWVVVISTPVVSTQAGSSQRLGVFGLMVRLGSFARLPGNAQSTGAMPELDSSFAVLIDSRPAHQGQILQHPLLNELDDRRGAANTASPRRQLLDRSQRDSQLRVAADAAELDASYDDPYGLVSSKYAQRWLSGRRPVKVRGEETGLSVIVQESYDQIIGQPLSQMRRGLVTLSLITLGLSAAVIIPLWAVILRLVR